MRKVQQREALEKFINERVLGERGFGFKQGTGCVYNHSANGGCEIGQYLSEQEAEMHTLAAGSLFGAEPGIAARFQGADQTRYGFWAELQAAHDYLALFTMEERYPTKEGYWEKFEEALQLMPDPLPISDLPQRGDWAQDQLDQKDPRSL